MSAEFSAILHLNSKWPLHESGPKRVAQDNQLVIKMVAAIEANPYTSNSANLINIVTGQCADETVKNHLAYVRELGTKVLSKALLSSKSVTTKVNLQTFHTQNQKPKKSKVKPSAGKSVEIAALLRITQVLANGGEVDNHQLRWRTRVQQHTSSLIH